MKTTIKIAMVALLAGAGMGATAGQAAGFSETQVKTMTVRFDDLDLRKPAGVATLHSRLRSAARNVCTDFPSGLRGSRARIECRTSALERAIAGLPAAVHTHHASWVAAGSKWLQRSEPLPARELAARR